MAGNVRSLVPSHRKIGHSAALLIALLVSLCSAASSQELYKYQDENGDWIFSDRPPDEGQVVESRKLEKSSADAVVDVTHSFAGTTVELTARNDFFAPVELHLEIVTISGLSFPSADQPMTWVLPPRSSTSLFQLETQENGNERFLEYAVKSNTETLKFSFLLLLAPLHRCPAGTRVESRFSAPSSPQAIQ
jgi:hypothetical protein